MKNSEIFQAIEDSFLRPEQKEALIGQLEMEGDSESFYLNLNEFLIEEIKGREQRYKEATDEHSERVVTLEEQFKTEKKKMTDHLSEALDKIKVTDTHKRKKVWDSFYEAKEKLHKKYEQAVKEITAKVSINFIED